MRRRVCVRCSALGLTRRSAVGVAAGTSINNTAEVTYTVGSVNATATSNTVSVTVAEILDVVVTLQTPSVPVIAGRDRSRSCVYRVTNTGNGPETFRLVDEQRDRRRRFRSGRRPRRLSTSTPTRAATCRPAIRRTCVGSNDPVLNADAFVTVLVVNDIPAARRRRQRRLLAPARPTRAPAPARRARPSPAQGVGGTDAVVGTTGADGEATGEYLVAGVAVTRRQDRRPSSTSSAARVRCRARASTTRSSSAPPASGTRDQRGVHRQHPGEHHLRAGHAAPQQRARSRTPPMPTPAIYRRTPTARVRVQLGTLTQASGSQTIQFAVTIN